MVFVKQKQPAGRQVRVADYSCPEGLRCELPLDGRHSIVTDEPLEHGGIDTATSPLMIFTSSLTACQTVLIVKVAEAMCFQHGHQHSRQNHGQPRRRRCPRWATGPCAFAAPR